MIRQTKPTSRDLKVLEYMKKGNTINPITALNIFKTTGLRDIIYRLRKADYDIESNPVYYKTSEGILKNYRNYSIKQAA